MSPFYTLRINKIERATDLAVAIGFELPTELQKVFAYEAGQYVTLKTTINGSEVRRAYSLCSSPHSGEWTVAVKEVPDGTFSALANNQLQVGDTLEVHPPEGKFILKTDPANEKCYAAFAAGSGITPILSMIRAVLNQEPKSKFVLVYGNRSVKETMFHKELLELQLDHPEQLHIEFIYSRTQEQDARFGRIERSTVNYVIKNKFSDFDFDQYFLCGPEPMIDEVSSVLKSQGVPEDKIAFELFTSSQEEAVPEEAREGESKLQVVVDEETFEFSMKQDQVILDAVLEEGIDAPYSCQGGICSSCIARITAGSATMRKNQILTDGEVAEGLVLTCQAHPTTPKVIVNYDEV
ncbi:2Fe-2S iron-sulfur cluster-binding protein [Croceiramulus getboli]|nr:ferredoxin--NADP reductase [Flavobacteriaceae bacterium YJPT1-3]